MIEYSRDGILEGRGERQREEESKRGIEEEKEETQGMEEKKKETYI